MDLIDGLFKELVVRLYAESSGQWLNIRMEISDECCPQGSVLGQIFFNIFINDINSRVRCTLSEFEDDTKLCGVVNTSEGWGVIQRNLDRSEQWALQYLKGK